MSAHVAPPTDVELMAFFDGELEEPRRAEVERYLEQEDGGAPERAAAEQKLVGLAVLGEAVRVAHEARPAPALDGLADAVMAALDADVGGAKVAPREVVQPLRLADEIPAKGKPANDNSRLIGGLTALAVAAAAALFVWGRGGDAGPVALGTSAPSASDVVAWLGDPPPTALASVSAPPPDAVDSDDAPGVEIAAVDFGAATGAIYYVPKAGQKAGATTTVVWLAEE